MPCRSSGGKTLSCEPGATRERERAIYIYIYIHIMEDVWVCNMKRLHRVCNAEWGMETTIYVILIMLVRRAFI